MHMVCFYPSFGAAKSCHTYNKGLTPHQRNLYTMKNSFVVWFVHYISMQTDRHKSGYSG